ncbi:hypothetical protein OIU85_005660 [Salix viminalis]|uniref:Uncharacterized protein n=1 Tax=Salix viminalis TaxID=40686 RepID=A0A9Q0PJA7_SALVM|nr:hypothetical protein OIU85_005660 [Salix viminalis]
MGLELSSIVAWQALIQIDLFPPPAGEGSSYEASSKDFRPSLSWSLDNGWIVPIPSVIDNHHPCALVDQTSEPREFH